MTLLRRALGIQRRGATGPWGDSSPPPPGGGGAGVLRSGDPLRVSTFLSCCLAVSEDVGMLPLDAYRRDRDTGSIVPVNTVPTIIADPFAENVTRISPQIGYAQVVMSLLLRGNAYASIVDLTPRDTPAALVVLNPDAVMVRQAQSGEVEYSVRGVKVDPATLVHILGPSLPGAVVGMNVVEMQRLLLGLAGGVDEFMASWMNSGVAPSGVLKVSRPLNATQAKQVKEQFSSAHAGVGKAGGVAVLGGGAEYMPLTLKPEDAQWLTTRGMLREDICGLLGVPPHRVGIMSEKASQGGGKGLEAQTLQYQTQTLMRWTSRIEHAWTRMIPGGTTLARHDWSMLLRADSTTRWTNHMIGRTIGAITNAEIRADEGLPPLDDPSMTDPSAPLNSAHALQGSAGPDGAADPAANGHRPTALTRALLALTAGQEN